MTQNVKIDRTKDARFEDFARQYTEFLIKVSKDKALFEQIVVRKDQKKLKEELKVTGVSLPESAFVMLDEKTMYAQAYLIGKDDQNAVAVIEQSLNVTVEPFNKEGLTSETVDRKDGINKIMVNVPKAAKDYSILVMLPFYAITNLEVKFSDGAEIVLSSC